MHLRRQQWTCPTGTIPATPADNNQEFVLWSRRISTIFWNEGGCGEVTQSHARTNYQSGVVCLLVHKSFNVDIEENSLYCVENTPFCFSLIFSTPYGAEEYAPLMSSDRKKRVAYFFSGQVEDLRNTSGPLPSSESRRQSVTVDRFSWALLPFFGYRVASGESWGNRHIIPSHFWLGI